MENLQEKFKKAARVVKTSRALIITSGAGMGIDSGLPDYRGEEGFWREYPLYRRLGINYFDAANPEHFSSDPHFGWGFYAHRIDLYRKTNPHEGFYILKRWIKEFDLDYFVVTSNVDGQFQKAGYPEEKIYEVHGSIHYLQCTLPCGDNIWYNDQEVEVDFETMRSLSIIHCPYCGAVARPNVLMFGDFSWIGDRSDEQGKRFRSFLASLKQSRTAVIEIGAGRAIPTIRNTGERTVKNHNATLIRVNPREYNVPSGQISLPCGGLEALQGIDGELQKMMSLKE